MPIYKIKQLAFRKRPREKLISKGPDVLKNAELLSIILNTGYAGESVLELASRVLHEYGSKAITKEKSVQRLMDELGLPPVKACQIIACFELGRRFFQEDTGRLPSIRGPEDIYKYLTEMRKLRKEHLRGLYLNARHKLIHDEVISIGSLTANIIHPREVFEPAIVYSAAGIILAHNHPSGDPAPSKGDIEITQQLFDSSRVLGIDFLDHIIVAKKGFISLAKCNSLFQNQK